MHAEERSTEDMHGSAPSAANVRPARSLRVTIAMTTLINLAMLPAQLILGIILIFFAGRMDSRGNPFASCTAESVECHGPNWWVIGVASLLMLALCFVGASQGYRFGRCNQGWRTLLMLTVLSIIVALTGTAILIYLIVQR